MSSAFTTAPPPSSSAPASMETLVAMLGRVVARFEARLEAQEQRLAMANTTPRPEPEFDPILGRPLTSWDLPRPRIAPESCSIPSDWNYSDPYAYDLPFDRPLTSWDLPKPSIPPEMCNNRSDWNPSVPRAFNLPPHQPAYLESYGGGGGYYNNYESQAWSYNNYESQAWSYNAYEPDRYNHVLQPVQYEPPPPVQYYSAAEPPQQQHYYPPPPSYTPMSDVDATLETDVNDAEIRVDARGDEIAAEPPFEEIGEEESPPTVGPKLEVSDADASDEQQLSEMQTDPKTAERVLDEMMELIDNPQTVVNNHNNKEMIWIGSWGESRNELHCLPVYEETCKSWKSKGVRLPALDEESRAPAFTLARSVKETNKKGEGSRKGRLKSREFPRRLAIFGLYALAEVYKDLHLEDKVIL